MYPALCLSVQSIQIMRTRPRPEPPYPKRGLRKRGLFLCTGIPENIQRIQSYYLHKFRPVPVFGTLLDNFAL